LVALLLHGPTLPLFLSAGAAFGAGRLLMPAARYLREEGDDWDTLIDARAGLIRASTAVVAALAAIVVLLAS
jgi:hypothetical protein